jgi:hypothetical protein
VFTDHVVDVLTDIGTLPVVEVEVFIEYGADVVANIEELEVAFF